MKYIILALAIAVLVGVSLWCPTCREWFKQEPVATSTPVSKLPAGLPNSEMITDISVTPGSTISSPITITGKARGPWYFEASFPISIVDEAGQTVVDSYATAQGEWMTENWVPFTSTITFVSPGAGKKGTLILKRDNPSGLPENDAQVEIPIIF